MKKILLLSLFALSACGTDSTKQAETFAAHIIKIEKSDVCENLDASVKDEMTDASLANLCATETACTNFEIELDCAGEWCVTHRNCRLE